MKRWITQHMLRQAAKLWWSGRDTLTIARKIQREEAVVLQHIDRIRALARLYAFTEEPKLTARHHAPFFVWTEENESELRTLWIAGKTSFEIARLFGTSRHAIIGKVNRLKLNIEHPHMTRFGTSRHLGGKKVKHPGGTGALITAAVATANRHRKQDKVTVSTPPTSSPAPQRALPAPDVHAAGAVYGKPVTFMELRATHCRKPMWPDGARPPVDELFYCGNRARQPSAYCDACRPALSYPMTSARTGRPFLLVNANGIARTPKPEAPAVEGDAHLLDPEFA